MGKHYLYRYVRLDTNVVFYVGIGTKHSSNFTTIRQEFRRAYNTQTRSKHFKNILNKSECILEIIMESDNHEFIKNKEVEFIKMYGRQIDGGTLINITLGGESSRGRVMSDSNKKSLSQLNSGGGNPMSKEVINVKTGKIYTSLIEASEDSKYTYMSLINMLNVNKRHKLNKSDLVYLKEYIKGVRPTNIPNRSHKSVICLDSNIIFDTVRKCADHFGKHPSYIVNILKNKINPKKNPINIKYYGIK